MDVQSISLSRLKQIVLRGELMMPSVQTTFMALQYLVDHGYLKDMWGESDVGLGS